MFGHFAEERWPIGLCVQRVRGDGVDPPGLAAHVAEVDMDE